MGMLFRIAFTLLGVLFGGGDFGGDFGGGAPLDEG